MNEPICRNCKNLLVLETGSQIILICTVTKRHHSYSDRCDCGCFKRKEKTSLEDFYLNA